MRLSFVVYDKATGRIVRHGTINCPDGLAEANVAAQTAGDESLGAVAGEGHPDTHYVLDEVLVGRPAFPAVSISAGRIRADGIDTLVVEGLPVPTTVSYRIGSKIKAPTSGGVVVDDGSLEWDTLTPGSYAFALEAWPNRDFTFDIEVTP